MSLLDDLRRVADKVYNESQGPDVLIIPEFVKLDLAAAHEDIARRRAICARGLPYAEESTLLARVGYERRRQRLLGIPVTGPPISPGAIQDLRYTE